MNLRLKKIQFNDHCLLSKVPLWIIKYFTFLFGTWVVLLVFRAVFFICFLSDLKPDSNYIYALYLGSKFDLRLSAILCLPLLFVLSLKKKYPSVVNNLISAIYSIILSLACMINIADIYHYSYLRKRINASVVDFIPDMATSISMVWQSYPVVRIVLFILVSLIVFFILIKKVLVYKTSFNSTIYYSSSTSKHPKLKKTASIIVVFLISFGFIYGQFSAYPLRWSNAYFSTDNFTSNLALNPILNLYETKKFSVSNPYSKTQVDNFYPLIKDYLKLDQLGVDTANLSFKRKIEKNPKALAHGKNIVLIIMESLAWNKLSWNLKDLDPTPNLTNIMNQSMVFSHFFSPALGTARGVFATITSIPDVTNLKSSSRNPAVIDQDMIINHMDGYDKFYFLGGSANWGNIRGVLQNNIKDLKVYEEGSYSGSSHRVDVWGIPDLDLFKEAARVFSDHKKSSTNPFFALIQTSSFHRPYTIPSNKDDFRLEKVDDDTLLKNSFISLDEYNSLRFSDYSVGVFFEKLKEYGLSEDTVVAIIGDHGLSAPRADPLPPGYQYYNLINHQIPLIIWSPSIIKHEINPQFGTQVDVMPTLAGLSGTGWTGSILGRDLLNPIYKADESNDGVFLYGTSDHPFSVSFINSRYLYKDMRTGIKGIYDYNSPDNYKLDLKDKISSEFNLMEQKAYGLYETARYLMYNNPK